MESLKIQKKYQASLVAQWERILLTMETQV